MKKTLVACIIASAIACTAVSAQASDWDTFGKVAAAIEGIRVVTGGSVDIFGTITGVNRPGPAAHRKDVYYTSQPYRYQHRHSEECRKVWVPHYVWKRTYVPAHREYSEEFGTTVLVSGRWVEQKIESGGHWEIRCTYQKGCGPYKNWSRRP